MQAVVMVVVCRQRSHLCPVYFGLRLRFLFVSLLLILVGWSPRCCLDARVCSIPICPRLATWTPFLKLELHEPPLFNAAIPCFHVQLPILMLPHVFYPFSILKLPHALHDVHPASSSGSNHRPWTPQWSWSRRPRRSHPSAPRGAGIGQRCLESRATRATGIWWGS